MSSEQDGPAQIPLRALTRGAKLAALPLGMAGRATLGLGKRIGGRPAEMVATEIQTRTAEQIFKVLGELKGGAMKFGQALSIFEAALPEALVGPYRATLVKLQDAAPPLPPKVVRERHDPRSWARTGSRCSPSSTRARSPPPASVRCTERCGRTVARWR